MGRVGGRRRAYLNEAADALERMQWNPDMDAAPKDGTEIDLWVRSVDRFFRLNDCKYGKEDYGKEFGWLEERPDEIEQFRYRWQFIEAVPTHWMPIPSPPEGE